jgi:hypothetical protein
VELRFQQNYDEGLGMFVNDVHTFEVIKVTGVVPKGGRQSKFIE